MANFYRTVCNTRPCDFQIYVSSVHPLKNIKYCTRSTRCRLDPNEEFGPGPFTLSPPLGLNETTHGSTNRTTQWSTNTTSPIQYRTASGRYIIAPGGQRPTIGQSVFRIQPKNETLWLEHMEENREADDAVLENLETIEDVIVGPA